MGKTVQIKIKKDNQWLDVNPITLAEGVNLNNGKNVENVVSEILKAIHDLQVKQDEYDKHVDVSGKKYKCIVHVSTSDSAYTTVQNLSITGDVTQTVKLEYNSNELILKNGTYTFTIDGRNGYTTPAPQTIVVKDRDTSVYFNYIKKVKPIIYGFRINQSGDGSIEYTDDCRNFRPITQDSYSSTVDYGDWENTFVLNKNKPVVFYDNTMKDKTYLNPNNLNSDISGRSLDRSSNYTMSEFGKTYYKFNRISDNVFEFKISNVKVDDSYTCNAFMDSSNNAHDYMYIGSYFTKFRNNISPNGIYIEPGRRGYTMYQTKTSISGVENNTKPFSIINAHQWQYINALIILITKNQFGFSNLDDPKNPEVCGPFFGSKMFNIINWTSNFNRSTILTGILLTENDIIYTPAGKPFYYNNGNTTDIQSNSINRNGHVSKFKCIPGLGIFPCQLGDNKNIFRSYIISSGFSTSNSYLLPTFGRVGNNCASSSLYNLKFVSPDAYGEDLDLRSSYLK